MSGLPRSCSARAHFVLALRIYNEILGLSVGRRRVAIAARHQRVVLATFLIDMSGPAQDSSHSQNGKRDGSMPASVLH